MTCHVTYSLAAGPIQNKFKACKAITTNKAYAWETSGTVGYARCVVTVL